MITEKTISADWLHEVNVHYKNVDRNLLDKVTHAFYLLEQLSKTDLEFIFKGGTSLLLLIDEMRRFSVDIDIVVTDQFTRNELDELLNQMILSTVFTRMEEQIRYKSNIPKAHYKFYYTSPFDNSEVYVLLDVLFEQSPYQDVIQVPIQNSLIETIPPKALVSIPTIENILGDKLTAFAPNTTGIPYGKGKEMEIIKQLFDIESLFDCAENLEKTRKVFQRCAVQELAYRGLTTLTLMDVLDDCIQTACIIGGRGSFERETFLKLEDGIQRIRSHILSCNYIVEEAVISASKVCYLGALLKNGKQSIQRFHSSIDFSALSGEPLFPKMNKIKKFSPEAYYYFSLARDLLKENL
jgi:hypothetical protein